MTEFCLLWFHFTIPCFLFSVVKPVISKKFLPCLSFRLSIFTRTGKFFRRFLVDFWSIFVFFSIFWSLLSEIKPSVISFIVRVWSPGLTDESWLSSSAQKGNNKVLFKPNELIIRCAMTCSCPQLQTTVKRRSCDNQRDDRWWFSSGENFRVQNADSERPI